MKKSNQEEMPISDEALKEDKFNKNLTNIGVIKDLFQRHGFSFSRTLGQNFLINPSVCPRIACAGGCGEDMGVLEIGAGIGVLTKELARRFKKVVVVEIDTSLAPILEETLGEFENVKIIYGDILQLDLIELINIEFGGMEAVCCANLPYYITSPVIMRLLEEELPLKSITVMVQREAAERITALPSTRECGAISVAVRYYSKPEKLFNVSRGSFMPSPNVDSAVIKLTRRENGYNLNSTEKKRFFKIVKSVFSQRRKQAANPLSADFFIPKSDLKSLLSDCGIDPAARAEQFTMDDFFKLNKAIGEYYENTGN